MKRLHFVLLFVTVMTWPVSAQLPDTIHLREVEVYGLPASRYASGTKVTQIQNTEEGGLLYKALADETTAYFKTYGNNQLSTVSFRGTSASHTAVLWNGININSPSLGQTDFSLLPTFLMEDIAVQYGTSSSLYGSDALGGSVILAQSSPRFEKGWRGQLLQQVGSFGRFLTGARMTVSTSRLEFRTKVFTSAIQNDFPYTSAAVGHSKKQNDASVENRGIDQQIHAKLNTRQQLSVEGMDTYNFRNIQPTVTHDSPDGTLRDQNSRLSLGYTNDLRTGKLFATVGYIRNKEVYNDSSLSLTDQINVLINMDVAVSPKMNLRYGVSGANYSATTDGYTGKVWEQRYDAFISWRQLITPRWTTTLNLRQSLYAQQQAPFAPSFGTEYNLSGRTKNKLLLRGQASRGYRVPTLNDRYWVPGGNPNLKPEDALHAEGGLSAALHSLKIDATYYKTWVDQWIIWLPGTNGIWSPSNLQKVIASGMEISATYSSPAGPKFQWHTTVNYAYTRSINQKGLTDVDVVSVGKQLPYVPLHNGGLVLKLTYPGWSSGFRVNYTGLRYTSLDNTASQSLDPYALIDFNLARTFELAGSAIRLRGDLNNILNTYYENNKSYAMPGRNYTISLTINFRNKPQL